MAFGVQNWMCILSSSEIIMAVRKLDIHWSGKSLKFPRLGLHRDPSPYLQPRHKRFDMKIAG